jgi:hypothetical protein
MEEVQQIIANPIIRQGLKVVAPELALGVDLVLTIFGSKRKRQPSLLPLVDKRLAFLLKEIATTKSALYRQECEIRAHELLGLLNTFR